MEDYKTNSNPQKPAEVQLGTEVKSQVNAPNTAPKQPSGKRWLIIAICFLVLIAISTTTVIIWHKPKAFVAPQHVTYSQTAQVVLPGPSSGSGISLQEPVELKDCGSNTKSRSCYWQYIASSRPKVVQAEVDLLAEQISTPVTDLYLNAVNEAFAGSSTSDDYKVVLTPVTTKFIYYNIGQAHNTKLSVAKPFTNATIKSNAWQFDLTVTPKNTQANSTVERASYNGKVIYALSKQTAYYISIMDIDYNWQGNQPTWQKVLDSLKIDQ